MRDAEGGVVRWYALLTDIDDRKSKDRLHRRRRLGHPGILEKLSYVVTLVVLHGHARISAADAAAAWPDLLLSVLFIAAFAKTRASDQRGGSQRPGPNAPCS